MRIGIAADHGGFPLKEQLVVRLKSAGHEVVDFGAHQLTPDDDYPDFVIPLAQAVAAGHGGSWCGGLRQRRRRVGLCEQNYGRSRLSDSRSFFGEARCRGRSHEHHLSWVAGRWVRQLAWDLVQTFLAAEFSQAERHLRRLRKVARLETANDTQER